MLLTTLLPNLNMGASDAFSPAPGPGNAEGWWVMTFILHA